MVVRGDGRLASRNLRAASKAHTIATATRGRLMMRSVLGLVAVLGLTLTQVRPADACGVKLSMSSSKIKKSTRSSNPSQVLVLGDAPKRLTSQLSEAGHDVEVADDAGA